MSTTLVVDMLSVPYIQVDDRSAILHYLILYTLFVPIILPLYIYLYITYCVVLQYYLSIICWLRRTYRALTALYPICAGVHIRVDTAQKKVNVCSAELHLFTIDMVYTYILHTKVRLTPKNQNPRFSKSSLPKDFLSSTKYIFILEL